MVEWITCIRCKNRFGSFMITCPICGTKNQIYNYMLTNDHKRKTNGKKGNTSIRNKRVIILSSIILATIFSLGIAIAFSWSSIRNSPTITIEELKQYALKKINESRAKYGLPVVELGENNAAQVHANELLKTEMLSHWTTDGMKPYMRYSLYIMIT